MPALRVQIAEVWKTAPEDWNSWSVAATPAGKGATTKPDGTPGHMNTLTEKGIPIFRIGVNRQIVERQGSDDTSLTIESSDDFETWYESVAICIAGNLVRKSARNRGMFLFVYHVLKEGPSGPNCAVKYTTTKDERGDTNWRSTMSFPQEGRLYYNENLMDVVHTALAPPRKASQLYGHWFRFVPLVLKAPLKAHPLVDFWYRSPPLYI